jgi:predicted metal-dependent phosphoesterase TrpH
VKFKIDLHVHSRNSGDNETDPEEAVRRAIELGLDGMAFTEHYSFEASEPVERLREKYRGAILIIRGVEFSAAEGHCLIFGVDTDRLDIRFAPIRDVVRIVTMAGGVVIPTHPYRGGNSMGELIFDVPGISAVEGCNGANMHAMNVKAVEAAGRMKLPYTGGSDAHLPIEVGSCYTVFDDTVTYENFLPLLKTGRFTGIDTRKISRALML